MGSSAGADGVCVVGAGPAGSTCAFRRAVLDARVARAARHLLDALAEMMRRRDFPCFMEWAEAMTGLEPKRTLVEPRVVVSVLREVARLRWAGSRAASSAAAGPLVPSSP